MATEIASKYGLKTSDVLLGYLRKALSIHCAFVMITLGMDSIVAKDVVVLPKSVTKSRIEANFTSALAAYNKLTPDDVAKLDGVAASGKQQRLITPLWGK